MLIRDPRLRVRLLSRAYTQDFLVVYRISLYPCSISFPLSLSLSYSRLNVYTRTQMPRVDVGRVISPESKAPASGVGTLVREFLNPFLHDFLLACPGLRLCPGLACCRLRVVEFLVRERTPGSTTKHSLILAYVCTVWTDRRVGRYTRLGRHGGEPNNFSRGLRWTRHRTIVNFAKQRAHDSDSRSCLSYATMIPMQILPCCFGIVC